MPRALPAWLAATALAVAPAAAINPFVQTAYTPDPAPMVHDGRLYVFTGHDEDGSTWFTMNEWRVYSTTDMVNWTDHGSPLSLDDFSWANKNAWAGHVIERDGRFYFYVPIERTTGGMALGVAVSDSPIGPYRDALGEPLIADGHGDIDPAAYIDDAGQAYLVWGNPTYKYVKLENDMVSYDKTVGDNGVFRHPMTVEAFGKRNKDDRATSYEEGPWLYSRGDRCYLFFAGGPISEHLAYSTGPSPEGPWTYGGVVMPTQGRSFTNHPGVVDYKGKTYLFYHNGALPGGGGFTRSACVDELEFRDDGAVIQRNMTAEGPAPVATLDPYVQVEAETIAWSGGVETKPAEQGGMFVHDIDDGDHIRVMNVDLGDGAKAFRASIRTEGLAGGSIELRLDRIKGPLVGDLHVEAEAGGWRDASTEVTGARGVHDLFLVFRGESGEDLLELDYWQFTSEK